MSLRARLLNTWLRRIERPALARMPADRPEKLRNRFAMNMRLIYGRPRKARQISVAGIPALEVGPQNDSAPILYLHGGGYVFGDPASYHGMCTRIGRAAGRRVIDLTVHFTDGDGNVGSDELPFPDTCRLEDYESFLERFDLYIYYYEQVNGQLVPIPPADSCLPYHNILPNLTPEGQNKTLEGNITTPFDYSNFPRNDADSIQFEMRLEDREGNSSERISSPAIAVP